MYSKKIVSLFSFVFIQTISFGMHSDIVLEQNLQKLTTNLENLQRALAKKIVSKIEIKKEQIQQQVPELPYELLGVILVNSLPEVTNYETFLEAIKLIRNFIQTSKQHKKSLENAMIKKEIIKKLFRTISSNDINTLILNAKSSNDPTVLGTINNVLYTINTIRKSTRLKKIDEEIQMLVEDGISPNFFIDKWNLFHFAIRYNHPELVSYLIDNDANINLLTKETNSKSPFIYAMIYSPQSALLLLKQNNIDLEYIKKNFKKAYLSPFAMSEVSADAAINVILILLERELIQPNDIGSYVSNGRGQYALGSAIYLFILSSERNLDLIKTLLKEKYNPQEEYYDYFEQKETSPLKLAEESQIPELLDLLKQYIK